jgi:hypothetical protein
VAGEGRHRGRDGVLDADVELEGWLEPRGACRRAQQLGQLLDHARVRMTAGRVHMQHALPHLVAAVEAASPPPLQQRREPGARGI